MPDLLAIRTYFQAHRDDMVASIRELVEFETPSTDTDCLDACARFLVRKFRDTGAAAALVEVPEGGDHVRVAWPVPESRCAPVLVLTHFDTVWPVGRIATHPFRIDDQARAYGPGIFDMKSSLIVMEYLFRALRDLDLVPARPITLLATADEEIGSSTSQALIEAEAGSAACVLVLEPPLPGGVLKTARKGSQALTLAITGIPAHAGIEIEKGVSAIEEAAHQILALQAMTNPETGITVNAGRVHGGTRANVVADRATIDIDLRGWEHETLEEASQAIHNLQPVLSGTTLRVKAARARPPLEERATRDLFHAARALAAQLDIELRPGRTGGGSDGNLTGALGVPTLDGLGIPGAGAHADHEHIELDQLVERAVLVSALVLALAPSSGSAAKALS